MSRIAVIGHGPWAVEVTLRHLARNLGKRDTLVVLDTRGCAARVADGGLLGRLAPGRLTWVDLADRARPVALLGFHAGGLPAAGIRYALDAVIAAYGEAIDPREYEPLVEAGTRLARTGTVTLSTLLALLDARVGSVAGSGAAIAPLVTARLQEAIAWALRYAGVHNISEGPNLLDLGELLARPGAVWLEVQTTAFEPVEFGLVAGLARAALIESLPRALKARSGHSGKLTLAEMLPARSNDLGSAAWVQGIPDEVRHICAMHVDPARGLAAGDRILRDAASKVWMVAVKPAQTTGTLPGLAPAESDRIRTLARGQVWLGGRCVEEGVVARVGYARSAQHPVALARARSASSRRHAEARQASLRAPGPGSFSGTDLAMYERIVGLEDLRAGWFHVRRGSGKSVGADGVTVRDFARDLDGQLASLASELREERYRPQPLRRVYLPKADGTRRPIGIVSIRDRIVQASALRQIEPLWEPVFSPFSFAFRPRRSAHDALALADKIIAQGLPWAVTADIRKCFDSVDHEVLLRTLATKIDDRRVARLVRLWLENDVEELADLFGNDIGVPQGALLSPLLANIYLDSLDHYLAGCGLRFVRYADDLLIFTGSRDSAKRALATLDRFVTERLNMQLKPAKTQFAHVREGVRFLGFELLPGSRKIAEPAIHRLEDKLEAFRVKLRLIPGPGREVDELLRKRDAAVVGWRNYFAEQLTPEVTAQLQSLDAAVRRAEGEAAPAWLRETKAWRQRQDLDGPMSRPMDFVGVLEEYPDPGAVTQMESSAWRGLSGAESRDEGAAPKAAKSVARGEVDDAEDDIEDGVIVRDRRMIMLAHGASITATARDLVVSRRRRELARAALADLEVLFIHAMHARMSVEAQVACAEAGVSVVVCGQTAVPVATIQPVNSRRSALRARQALRRADPAVVRAGLSMLQGKVTNQAAVLQYFAKYLQKSEPSRATEQRSAAQEIRALARQITGLDPAGVQVRSVAMGLEGRAAATYWRGFSRLLPADSGFNRRVTLGAEDVWNQCLNYSYGLLYAEVWAALVSCGLDPYFGIMHGSSQDQGSLVFDMIEEFRAPFADRVVAALAGRGMRPALGSHGMLRTRTRRKLAGAFFRRWRGSKVKRAASRVTGSRLLELQAQSIVRVFRGEGTYRCYRMKW